MKNLSIFALLATAAFATASAIAGTHGCGSKMAACEAGCDLSMAGLNLTEGQKTKLAEIQSECDKEGCTDSDWERFLKSAEAILSPEQFARLKEACRVATKLEKPQT